MKTVIVIPVFNEEKHIAQVLKNLQKTKLPVVVVDDGSEDATSLKLRGASKSKLKVLTHKINLGKGAALKTGCDWAFDNGAQGVILMDSDGQHDPGDLSKFIKKLDEGYDVVFGSRNLNLGVPIDRYMGNKIASLLIGLLFGIYVSDLICGFKALTKKAYKKVRWESKGYSVETEIAIKTKKAKLKHCEVPVETIYYDSFKGVSVMDAFGVFNDIIKWYLGFK